MKAFSISLLGLFISLPAFATECDQIYSATLNLTPQVIGSASNISVSESGQAVNFYQGGRLQKPQSNSQNDSCTLFAIVNSKPGGSPFSIPDGLVANYELKNANAQACAFHNGSQYGLWVNIDNEQKLGKPWPNFSHKLLCYGKAPFTTEVLKDILGDGFSIELK